MFGLNQKTGIQIPNENKGFIPDRKWKREVKNDEWWPGETISVAIGQGGVLVTPLQLVNMMAAIANRGRLYRPNILKDQVVDSSRVDSTVPDREPLQRTKLSSGEWDKIFLGLELVVSGSSGTARKLKMRELTVAGKTGTAQVISGKALKKMGYIGNDIPEKYRDHNWFAGYAPVEKPEVALVVFIENGGKTGAAQKVLIARKTLLKWYALNSPGKFGPEPQILTDQLTPERGNDTDG